MKKFRKLIAIILTVVLSASIALPVFASAEDVDGDHTSFDEFWNNMTDEDGSVKWQELPKTLFDVFVFVRIFEVIADLFRDFFGIEKEPAVEETTTNLADVEIVAA